MAEGRTTVGPGQVIGSDWGNTVWDQSIQTFASSADRATQYPAPHEGAAAWLEDTNRLDVWDGSQWRTVLLGSTGTRTFSASSVVTTNSAGGYTIGFGPFLSTPVVVACDGDSNGSALLQIGVNNSESLTTSFGGVARTYSGVAIVSSVIRVNWIATG